MIRIQSIRVQLIWLRLLCAFDALQRFGQLFYALTGVKGALMMRAGTYFLVYLFRDPYRPENQ